MEAPENLQKEDDKLRKRKNEIGTSLDRCRKDLQNHVLYDLTKTYVFEQGGEYFKIGTGSTSLEQPSAEELRTVGVDFRRLMTSEPKLRSLTFLTARDIINR